EVARHFAGDVRRLVRLADAARRRGDLRFGDPPRPMPTTTSHAIVQQLSALIETHGWANDFELAIRNAHTHDVPGICDIQDLDDYLGYINDLVTWAPRERGDSRLIYNRMAKLYFILDQDPVKALQSPIVPSERPAQLTP